MLMAREDHNPVMGPTYTLPDYCYQKFGEEMKCAICLQVYVNPQQLPCFHFFCQACLRSQITNQKTVDVMPRCAECNVPFNRR